MSTLSEKLRELMAAVAHGDKYEMDASSTTCFIRDHGPDLLRALEDAERLAESGSTPSSARGMAAVRERPILMSAPMVRAILEGRKTQTRRVVKPQPEPRYPFLAFKKRTGPDFWLWPNARAEVIAECPYGQVGDQLWVRETFSGPHCMDASDGCKAVPPSKWGDCSRIWYWADGNPTEGDWTRPRPSIHMPRWASRILLEITAVRVERLQDISEADAKAEGAGLFVPGHGFITEGELHSDPGYSNYLSPRQGFEQIWTEINGPGSWDAANPWVWVLSFKRIAP